MNTDYKILAKLLANRLQKVISSIIDTDQCGYIKGRYIGQNIRLISDVIHLSKTCNVHGALLFVDFEKAFDSIRWPFLHRALKAFNFGNTFCSWIKILYNCTSSCITNNGHSTAFFPLSRGIRQGCPVGALLFIIAVEMLAIKIRTSQNIHGLRFAGTEVRISQLADDTTLFLEDLLRIQNALNILTVFYWGAGLHLNRGKTEALWLGKPPKYLQKKPFRIKWANSPVRSLGVWFHPDEKLMEKCNFEPRVANLEAILNAWSYRNLSLIGKVTIVKTLAIPQLTYIASVLPVPDYIVKNVTSAIYNFLWSGKRDKIKRCVVASPIDSGGLNMIDFQYHVKALKVAWIKRFLEFPAGKWKSYLFSFFQDFSFKDFINSKFDKSFIRSDIPMFYQQMLAYYSKLNFSEPQTRTEICDESLWFNRFIVTGDKKPLFFKEWYDKGIKTISDIVDDFGSFIDMESFFQRYTWKPNNFIHYLSL